MRDTTGIFTTLLKSLSKICEIHSTRSAFHILGFRHGVNRFAHVIFYIKRLAKRDIGQAKHSGSRLSNSETKSVVAMEDASHYPEGPEEFSEHSWPHPR